MTEETVETVCTGCDKSFTCSVIGEGRFTYIGKLCDACQKRSSEEWDRKNREHQEDQERYKFKARVKYSKLPRELYRMKCLPDTPPTVKAAVKAWGDNEINGLCLTGDIGVGKTCLAAAACWHRLHFGQVRWVRVTQLMTQLKAGFGDAAKEEANAVIAGTGAIVLDDLDKANPTEFGREVLLCAIDGRVQEGNPLLVTTNLAMSEIGARLDDSIASRLAGYCEVVRMVGPDRRLGNG